MLANWLALVVLLIVAEPAPAALLMKNNIVIMDWWLPTMEEIQKETQLMVAIVHK